MNRRFWPPLLAFLTLSLIFELSVRFEYLNPALFPAPSAILKAIMDPKSGFLRAMWSTGKATVFGFALASVIGFCLAVGFSLNLFLRRAVLPFAIFFQTVPIIAVAPLLVIYFGFGLKTVVVSSAIVAIFPVLASTLLGLESTDAGFLELMQIYKASALQTLIYVRLPLAYSSIYSGLKIAAGLSVIGTVAGEFVAGGGLGAIIDSARTQQRTDMVFGALVLLSLIGLFLMGVLRLLNALINRYRPYGLSIQEG